MNATEVIPSKVQRQGRLYPHRFLLSASVSLASLRMGIGTVKLWRSICEVKIKRPFGDPVTGIGIDELAGAVPLD